MLLVVSQELLAASLLLGSQESVTFVATWFTTYGPAVHSIFQGDLTSAGHVLHRLYTFYPLSSSKVTRPIPQFEMS